MPKHIPSHRKRKNKKVKKPAGSMGKRVLGKKKKAKVKK